MNIVVFEKTSVCRCKKSYHVLIILLKLERSFKKRILMRIVIEVGKKLIRVFVRKGEFIGGGEGCEEILEELVLFKGVREDVLISFGCLFEADGDVSCTTKISSSSF